jgi:phage tail sheath protein FI
MNECHVSEMSAFGPSVVGVETAVPAFIGYTERADVSGVPATMVPVRIASMMDYEQYFGRGVFDVRPAGIRSAPKFSLETVPVSVEGVSRTPGSFDAAYETAEGTSTIYSRLTPVVPMFSLYNSLRLFYANGGGPCYIVSVGRYEDVTGAPTAVSSADLMKGLDSVRDQAGPTLLLIPDASLLPVGEYGDIARAMMKQGRDKQDRVALLDVPQLREANATPGTKGLADGITAFRAAIGTENLSYGIAYFPYLATSVVKADDLDYTIFDSDDLADYLLAEWKSTHAPEASAGSSRAIRQTLKNWWPDENGAETTERKKKVGSLLNVFPQLTSLFEKAARQMNLLPASVAMAGVMTVTDNTRGVWHAPANIALNAVDGPAFGINDETQADLNKPLDGKAINVIRDFVGRGPIVWGARTLDGNSNDYRYVQVRRTLIYLEQSIKAAMKPFVFAANDGKTWVSVVAMVSNFLQNLWARGGLMGATPQEAFVVNCGLGTTMSAQDVLAGYMVVQVLVQMTHPAEFFELSFKQKLESVG